MKYILLLALCWLLWVPEQIDASRPATDHIKGNLHLSGSRGRYYIAIDKKNIYCSEGMFGLSTDCPPIYDRQDAQGNVCMAEIAHIQTKIGMKQDILLTMSCNKSFDKYFTRANLLLFRENQRDWLMGYFSLPIFILIVIALIFNTFRKDKP